MENVIKELQKLPCSYCTKCYSYSSKCLSRKTEKLTENSEHSICEDMVLDTEQFIMGLDLYFEYHKKIEK